MTDLRKLQRDPSAFRQAIRIETDDGPRPFSEVCDDWQARDFAALDSGWKRAVFGTAHAAEYQRGWIERPRGHSKSLDLGIMAAWALFASKRRLSGIGAAGDRDQARLLRDAIGRIVYDNEWLSDFLEVQAYAVTNRHTGSTLEIISSDAPTAYGLTPDFCIVDEISHWQKRDLWDSLFSSAAKRSTCMLVCILNAGFQDDEWVWQTREAVKSSDAWYFSRLEHPAASWIDAALLEEQRKLLPRIAYERLWLNRWADAGGDALDRETIEAAFSDSAKPQSRANTCLTYVAGLDLGVSRDASALCIIGVRRSAAGHARMTLADLKLWKPAKSKRVDLQEVENACVDACQRFGVKRFLYDPWQAAHMASRLQALGQGRLASRTDKKPSLAVVEVPPVGNNLQRIASALLEAFNDGRIHLFDSPDLRRDLLRLRVEERSYGFRLTSPRDEHGHGDSVTALSLAILAAQELAQRKQLRAGAWEATPRSRTAGAMAAAQRRLQHANHHEARIASGGADYSGAEAERQIIRRLSGGRRG